MIKINTVYSCEMGDYFSEQYVTYKVLSKPITGFNTNGKVTVRILEELTEE